jgi:hypothetical protein
MGGLSPLSAAADGLGAALRPHRHPADQAGSRGPDPARRSAWLLTYSLGDGPGMLPVYITWQLEPAPAGTIVRLYVDETGPPDRSGLELTWLPALEALRTRLASRRHEP